MVLLLAALAPRPGRSQRPCPFFPPHLLTNSGPGSRRRSSLAVDMIRLACFRVMTPRLTHVASRPRKFVQKGGAFLTYR
jgi:hypothetical protein